MAREKANYRIVLEDILTSTGGKRLLNVSDVARYTGKGMDWCRKHVPFSNGHITAVALAQHFA